VATTEEKPEDEAVAHALYEMLHARLDDCVTEALIDWVVALRQLSYLDGYIAGRFERVDISRRAQ